MQDMSLQAQIMKKCLKGSGGKSIKEMDNKDKICICLFMEKIVMDGKDEMI